MCSSDLFYLVQMWRGRPVNKLAAVMARLAFVESAALLNSAAGLVITLVMGSSPRAVFGPMMGLVFAVAQVAYFFRMARSGQ